MVPAVRHPIGTAPSMRESTECSNVPKDGAISLGLQAIELNEA